MEPWHAGYVLNGAFGGGAAPAKMKLACKGRHTFTDVDRDGGLRGGGDRGRRMLEAGYVLDLERWSEREPVHKGRHGWKEGSGRLEGKTRRKVGMLVLAPEATKAP